MKPSADSFGVVLALSASFVSFGCGGATFDPGEEAATGGSSSGIGGGSAGTGGTSSGTGGIVGPAGTGGQATGGGVGSGGDLCAMAGCAAPPLCAEGCTALCGCCLCTEGEARDIDGLKHACVGGCWAPVDVTCEYLGTQYSYGATFPASDGCNECECLPDGTISCTLIGCLSCDPDAEIHVRSYVAESPEECMLIDYVCPENTTPFGNDCGCGCEQSPDCPEWFDCMPTVDGGEPCDEEAIRAECPYSGIAY